MALRDRLLRRKKKIELLLPVAGQQRGEELRRQLARLNEVLNDPGKLTKEEAKQSPYGASGVDGIGGLMFEAQAPPGLGRLVRIPFLLSQVAPSVLGGAVVSDGGPNLPAINTPTIIVGLVNQRSLGGLTFETPIIEWATLRVVGFQADYMVSPSMTVSGDSRWFHQRPFLMVKNLMVSGGANLFSMEGYQDGTVYTTQVPEFAGLRDYPIVQAPNFMRVEAGLGGIQFFGPGPGSGPTVSGSVTLSMEIIAEVLDDAEYGRHISGPYARKDALLRIPHRGGDNFVLR